MLNKTNNFLPKLQAYFLKHTHNLGFSKNLGLTFSCDSSLYLGKYIFM